MDEIFLMETVRFFTFERILPSGWTKQGLIKLRIATTNLNCLHLKYATYGPSHDTTIIFNIVGHGTEGGGGGQPHPLPISKGIWRHCERARFSVLPPQILKSVDCFFLYV